MKPLCQQCPLYTDLQKQEEWIPVDCEIHDDDRVAIIGETPGGSEISAGRPFVGPGGQVLQRALELNNIPREQCRIDNALACRPPQGDLAGYMLRLGRRNSARRKKGEPEWLTPQTCCKPRLFGNLKDFSNFLLLGKEPAAALRGGSPAPMRMRGTCEVIPAPWDKKKKIKVAYTLHPDFVLHSPKWEPVFQHDIAKAFRFFSGNLKWDDPNIEILNSIKDLRRALKIFQDSNKLIAYDVETDGVISLITNLRCIGISNDDYAVVWPVRSIQGDPFWSEQEEKESKKILQEFFSDTALPIVGHNAGQFDRTVMEQYLGITPRLDADTILLHLLTDNEMPHNLGFVGSFYTDFTEAWKADHTATTAQTDKELYVYCAKDACVTARIAPILGQEVKKRNQWHLLEREHKLQSIGAGMQRLGLRVDLGKAREREAAFERKLIEETRVAQEIAGKDFNPNSTHQLRNLLFSSWALSPVKYNEKTGDPSTDDDSLRRMITDYGLDEERVRFLQSIRLVRRYGKLLGTYLRPLRLITQTYGSGGLVRRGIVLRSGRVHPSYNRLPATGRYSSSGPNAQNIPYDFRDLFIPEEGHVFVGTDMDQLALRLIAEEANAKRLLKSFADGYDPHNETMEMVYGSAIWEMDGAPKDRKKKGEGTFKSMRGITKNVRYAWQYAASVPKIHEQVISAEDENGKLVYAHLKKRDIRQVVRGLERADPEIPRWWRAMQALYRKQGFVSDTFWGRRRDFRDEEKINEIVNHPVQAGGAVIVHEAMLELVLGDEGTSTEGISKGNTIPFDFENNLGLVNQCHDSLVFEVPEDDAEEISKQLTACMTRKRKHNPRIVYTAEAEIGMNWKEV